MLKHVARLWGFDVHLESIDSQGHITRYKGRPRLSISLIATARSAPAAGSSAHPHQRLDGQRRSPSRPARR